MNVPVLAVPSPAVTKPTDCVGILLLKIQASGAYTLRAEGQQDVLIRALEEKALPQLKAERAGAVALRLKRGDIKED